MQARMKNPALILPDAMHASQADGPYAESKDLVGGYCIVKADDLAQATELARGCPILDSGGGVEVRPIMSM